MSVILTIEPTADAALRLLEWERERTSVGPTPGPLVGDRSYTWKGVNSFSVRFCESTLYAKVSGPDEPTVLAVADAVTQFYSKQPPASEAAE